MPSVENVMPVIMMRWSPKRCTRNRALSCEAVNTIAVSGRNAKPVFRSL